MAGTARDRHFEGGSHTVAAGRALLRALRDDIAIAFDRRGRDALSALGSAREWRTLLAVTPVRAWKLACVAVKALEIRRSTRRVLYRLGICLLVLTAVGSLALTGGALWALQDWPVSNRSHDEGRPALLLEAGNGNSLGRMGDFKLHDVKDFPRRLIEAVVSIEDRRFYYHHGVDPIGIARAAYQNFLAGGVVEGGSTITQQLIKIKYLRRNRRFARKLREAAMAMIYEWRHSKNEILAEYLNSVYLGEGAYGMPAAARLYFNKPLSELTLAEAAMLAGMINSPSQLDPIHDLPAAQARAGLVIDAMQQQGMIDVKSARQAKAHPATPHQGADTARARSWFADWASDQAAGLADVHGETVRVRTTLIPKLQRLAERVINDALAKHGNALHASQAALVAMRPDGAVVAMVGGRDYNKSQFNRAAEANRQPGSAFKLFVYLTALRKGYRPDDIIDARPISIGHWTPKNYDGRHYGSVTLAEGFARSINTAAVRLAMDVGLENVIAAARDLGIDAPLKPYPSLALGATGVSLVDLTGAFASVRAGHRVEPWGIAAVGNGVQSDLRAVGPRPVAGKALGPARDEMITLLRRVIENGTGRRAALDGFAAGKTGTSQDYRDAWFVGFNEPLVAGVWVGNDDNSPMKRVVGGALPAMIWQRFMAKATKMIEEDQILVAEPGTRIPQVLDGVFARATDDNLDDPSKVDREAEPAIGGCNVAACSRAYDSFRASDCTFQPYHGPRQLCARGLSGEETEAIDTADSTPPQRRARHRPVPPTIRRLFRIFRVR